MAGDEDSGVESRKTTEQFKAEEKLTSQLDAGGERPKELLDTYIGAVVHGPTAARRFNDLIAKTLKLKP